MRPQRQGAALELLERNGQQLAARAAELERRTRELLEPGKRRGVAFYVREVGRTRFAVLLELESGAAMLRGLDGAPVYFPTPARARMEAEREIDRLHVAGVVP